MVHGSWFSVIWGSWLRVSFGSWFRVNGSRLRVNGEGLIITVERSSIWDLGDYFGSFFFCLHEFGGVFYHYRWGMVAIGGRFEQKLGMDDINKRD